MISGFKASVQTELNAFFAHLANQADLTRKASAQAFSKACKQCSHRTFAHLNQRFMMLVSSHLPPRWNNLRVATCGFYLPGSEMILSAELYSANVCWRQLLFEHIYKLSADDLLVLVPGYPVGGL